MEDYKQLAIEAIVQIKMDAWRLRQHIKTVDTIIKCKTTRKDAK